MSAMYRLTLTADAFALALMHSKPMAGRMAVRRPDNKWDVMITQTTYESIKAFASQSENFSDTVIRAIKEKVQ